MVVAVFEHQMNVPPGFRGKPADRRTQVVQDRNFAHFDDGIDGIEAQPVEAIIAQPRKRVLDGEGAHLRHAVVDRAAPRRVGFGEELWRVAAEIISFGSEVIIDHIEEHHQPAQMRFVDHGLEIVGAAIGAVGCVPQHAVITPAALACEIRKRHQFKRRDPGLHEMIELFDHLTVSTPRRERSNMSFDQHGFLPGPSAPIPGAPWVACVIDHLARTGNIFGLKRRGRIGHVDLVIDPEFVARAGLHAGDVGGKPAFVAALHCLRFVQQQLHALCCRRPKVERRAVCRRPRTELSLIHAEPAKASTERGGALAPAPAAKSAVVCLASAV